MRAESGIEGGFARAGGRLFGAGVLRWLSEQLFVSLGEATVEGGIRLVEFRSVEVENDSRGLFVILSAYSC